LKKQGGNEKSLLAKESTGEVKTWNSPALQRNIPVAMKNSPNWVPMKLYQGKGTGQNKKFFIDVNNPASGFADYRDPKTWTTYEKALDYAKANHCDGISFAVKNSNVNAIVLNQCHDGKKGHYNETAQNLINELPDTYIEKSFSGSGLHILTTSSICENGKYQEGSGTAINVYETIGFVPVTGKVIDKNHKNLAEISEKTVKWIQNNLITSTSSKTFVQNKVNSEEIKKRGYKGR
jgi:primase-polymerase (primpol)-like protein